MRFNVLTIMMFAGLWLAGAHASDGVKTSSPGAQPLPDPPGVHNLYLLGTNVFSGSTPEGEEGYAALAKLGVKTIVSVDGAKPDVELARKFGMRYVHLPHGYDGIGTNVQLKLAKTSVELPGPIYVHCHHGKHRGPAAAAVICMVKNSWDAAQAEGWLRAAGTSTNYAGLYETVRTFKKPTAEEIQRLPFDFPETAHVSGLVDAMVSIDARWEHLKAVRSAGYAPPPTHPDIQPANEAVILWENYREAQRLPDAGELGTDFIDRLKTAEAQVKESEALLREFSSKRAANLRARLDQSFETIGKTCVSCHKDYRNVSANR